MAEYALRLASAVDTAPRVRMGDALSLFPNGALKARGGLRPDGGGAVTVNAGAMTVQVEPFTAWVSGGSSGTQGGYPFILDAAKTLTITDGDAALTRTDTVAAVVSDDVFDGSGSTLAEVVVVTGTPGAGAPALPPSAVALRDISVPAGLSAGTGGLSSSNLGADRRTWLAAAGGVLPVTGATERDALTPVAGMAVYRLDTDRLEVFNGTTWGTYVEATQLPVGNTETLNLNSSGYGYVNHGLGTTPRSAIAVQASHVGTAMSVAVTEVGPTRFRVTCRDEAGNPVTQTTRNVYWIAIP